MCNVKTVQLLHDFRSCYSKFFNVHRIMMFDLAIMNYICGALFKGHFDYCTKSSSNCFALYLSSKEVLFYCFCSAVYDYYMVLYCRNVLYKYIYHFQFYNSLQNYFLSLQYFNHNCFFYYNLDFFIAINNVKPRTCVPLFFYKKLTISISL